MKYYFEKYKEEHFKVLYEMKKDNFKWYVEKLYGWDEETQTQFQKDFIEEHRNDINVIKVDNEIIGAFTNYINENNESVISLFYIDKNIKNKELEQKFYKSNLKLIGIIIEIQYYKFLRKIQQDFYIKKLDLRHMKKHRHIIRWEEIIKEEW